MAANAPTTVFRNIPTSTTTAAVDTKSERATLSTGNAVSTGNGNEWDFGSVNISDGAANSGVRMLFWKVTYANGNDTVDNFKFWLSQLGFDQAASQMKYVSLSFADTGTTTNNHNVYVANATTGTYNWQTATEGITEPGAQNVFGAADTTSFAITGVTTTGEASEVVAIASYFAIADEETTGTYKGTTTNYELRCSFKFDFS